MNPTNAYDKYVHVKWHGREKDLINNYWRVPATTNITPRSKKSITMNWAHIEKAPKLIHQEVITLKSTGPK